MGEVKDFAKAKEELKETKKKKKLGIRKIGQKLNGGELQKEEPPSDEFFDSVKEMVDKSHKREGSMVMLYKDDISTAIAIHASDNVSIAMMLSKLFEEHPEIAKLTEVMMQLGRPPSFTSKN